MICTEEPEGFNPRIEVVSCLIEHDNEIVMVHRLDHKEEGDKWGIPAGKLDLGETLIHAVVREVKEETGLDIPEKEMKYLKKIFVRYPTYDFIFHVYRTKLKERKEVIVSKEEHKDIQWMTVEKAMEKPIVAGLEKVFPMFYSV